MSDRHEVLRAAGRIWKKRQGRLVSEGEINAEPEASNCDPRRSERQGLYSEAGATFNLPVLVTEGDVRTKGQKTQI